MEQRQEGVGTESGAAGGQCYANMTFTSDGPVLPQRMRVKCCQKLLFRCPILHNAKLRSLRWSRLRRIVQKGSLLSLLTLAAVKSNLGTNGDSDDIMTSLPGTAILPKPSWV